MGSIKPLGDCIGLGEGEAFRLYKEGKDMPSSLDEEPLTNIVTSHEGGYDPCRSHAMPGALGGIQFDQRGPGQFT